MKTLMLVYLLLVISQFVVAFICGPYSCEWGNTVYFWYGIVGLIIGFLWPFFRQELPLSHRFAYAFGFALLWVVMWVAGFLVADLRIMCKLF